LLQLAWPWVLGAAVLPLLAARLLPRAPETSGAAVRVPFFSHVRAWSDPRAGRRPDRRLTVAVAAWLLLVLAGARPLWVGEPVALEITGRDLMLAVDLSGSMNRRDLRLGDRWVSRLRVVKRVAGEFIERRDGDRIGLILFGTRAYLQAPLTFDRPTVRTLLGEAVIGLAGEQTAIGDAIGLAVKRLRERPAENRVLILLTDGTNTAGHLHPLDSARFAAKQGIRIYTIGVGADPATLRERFGSSRRARAGDLDESMLVNIARITGGRYFRARETTELVEIYRVLDDLEPVIGGDEQFRPRRELFHWPLAVAYLLAVMLLLPGRLEGVLPRWRRTPAGGAEAARG